MTSKTCYIGMGSNLAQPTAQLNDALHAIQALSDTHISQCSSFYASKPMGPQDQPDYVNAVVALETRLTAIGLLAELQGIEQAHGRVRKAQRWGPRTLDLDILLFGSEVIATPDLTVPHYGLTQREFVVYPLHEIAPDLVLPCGNSLICVLNKVSRNGLTKLDMDISWM